MVFNRFYIDVQSLFININKRPILSVGIFKRLYTYIYKCPQYNNNRADIWMQLNGALAFWASKSPLADYHSNQILASSICRLMSAASFLWTMWRVFTSSQLFLEKNSAGCSTPRKYIHNSTVRSKTPTLMCIQCVWLVQSLRLIHGFIKVSEHCYSAEMMPTFLFCCFALIWASWRRCTCGRHLNANLPSWFNARKKSPKWLF